MKRKFLKIVAVVALLSFLATPAFAFVSLVATAAELAAPFIIQAGITYFMPASATTNLPKYGSADSYGVKRNFLAKVAPAVVVAVTGYMAWSELRSHINQTDEPNLYAATHPVRLATTGDTVTISGKTFLIQEVFSPQPTTNTTSTSSSYVYSSNYGRYVVYINTGQVNPVYLPSQTFYIENLYFASLVTGSNTDLTQSVTDSQLQSALYSPSLADIYPVYQPEIDKIIQANPNSVSQLPNSDVAALQSQLSKSDQISSLQAIVDSKQAAYTANPTQDNLDALNKAKADLSAAQSDQSKQQSDASKQQADESQSVEQSPALHKFDFSPFLNLGAAFADKFPFTLLSTCKAMVTGLVTSPVAPSFTIHWPAPFNYDWVVSLDRWNSWASLLRVLIGGSFVVACSFAILRRWV